MQRSTKKWDNKAHIGIYVGEHENVKFDECCMIGSSDLEGRRVIFARNDQREAHARIFAKDHDQEEKPYWNERSEDHNKPHQKVEALSKRDVLYNQL